jgi:hypothetical protein
MAATISLPTTAGGVELREADGPRSCIACGVRGGGLLDVDARAGNQGSSFAICGNCVSSAVAVYLRFKRNIEGARREHPPQASKLQRPQ